MENEITFPFVITGDLLRVARFVLGSSLNQQVLHQHPNRDQRKYDIEGADHSK